MPNQGILVVDDEPAAAEYLTLALQEAHHDVRVAAGGIEALLAIERVLPALVITDLQMPGMNGLELLGEIKERWPDVAVMLVSVEQEASRIVEAMQRGAVNYLVKPTAPAVLQSAVANALSRQSQGPPPPEAGNVPEIVGRSPAILKVRHLVTLAARCDANVVIAGETGTGKELVAQAIRRLSFGGSPRPFVAHNCALTPPDLFDSEFFGHRRGSFTGAERDRAGLLQRAHGGILFLDELECLSLPNQAKLLRVLDDGEIRALGSEEPRLVSVRFLAATNRSPRSMLAARELREDLYFRLRGFQIDLPSLSERREDIPLLVAHYLEGRGKQLASAALAALCRSGWPGNVRQLRSVLDVACASTPGSTIDVRNLRLTTAGIDRVPAAPVDAAPGPVNLRESERRAILAALAAHGGSRSRTARALGIHRSTLRRKLRESKEADPDADHDDSQE